MPLIFLPKNLLAHQLCWNEPLAVNGKQVKTLTIQRPVVGALNYLRLEARSNKNNGSLKLADVAMRKYPEHED